MPKWRIPISKLWTTMDLPLSGMDLVGKELSSIGKIVRELPTWAFGSKSARPGAPSDDVYERLVVAGNWIGGDSRFVTCHGKDRKGVCRIRDARLCQIWVGQDGSVFQTRPAASRHAEKAPQGVFACTWLPQGQTVHLSCFLREATIGSLVTGSVLRADRCPFFVEYLGGARTYGWCMTAMELCDTSLSHLVSSLDDDEILSVIRQMTVALVVGEESQGLRFDRSLNLTSVMVIDTETSNVSWRKIRLNEETVFCVIVGDKEYRFRSHGILAKLSGYSTAEIRFRDVTLGQVRDVLTPQDVVEKILCQPCATGNVSAETKTFLSELCKTKGTEAFCSRLFSFCEEGFQEGDVVVGSMVLGDRGTRPSAGPVPGDPDHPRGDTRPQETPERLSRERPPR